MSAGEMVFSSTKMTPTCRRSCSAQVLSSGGMVRRSVGHEGEPLCRCFAKARSVLLPEEDSVFPFRHTADGECAVMTCQTRRYAR